MRYCKNCGAELSEDSKFCSQCGTPVDGSDSLDRELKETKLENEKTKGKISNLTLGLIISGVLLFTAGPVFAGINLLVWIVIAMLAGEKKK